MFQLDVTRGRHNGIARHSRSCTILNSWKLGIVYILNNAEKLELILSVDVFYIITICQTAPE